ncbi:hypothetical protein ACIBI7_51885 [Nonomuraea fuscirosea]|uniref:hypothetical protein n=1 Tax=Nonomuraea fuscirosea TaxID=1291556 RepID=UPI0037A629A0
MSKFKPSTLFASAIIAAGLAVSAVTLPATAQTSTQTSTQSAAQTSTQNAERAGTQASTGRACWKIRVTARTRVAIREFQFVNADVLRSVRRGTVLTSCQFVRGGGANSYPNKCGRSGRNWFQVYSGTRTAFLNSPFGYVPATCARVVS